jgi:antitoxin ParD1/3/4
MDEQNEIEWLKAMIAEGEASGVLDAEPEDILAEIMAKLPASDCP